MVSDEVVTRNARVELEPSDAELVSAAATGDLRAFEQLVGRWQPMVVGLTRRAQAEHDVVSSTDDLAQQVWIKVWGGLPAFRFECEFSTWLYRVVSTTVANARRARGRRAVVVPFVDDSAAAADDVSEDVLDGLLVRGAVEDLDELVRCVFLNRVVHGLTWDENASAASAALGRHVSVWDARSSYRSALATLQRQLGDQ